MYPSSSKIAKLVVIFGWYIPMWLLIGLIPSVAPAINPCAASLDAHGTLEPVALTNISAPYEDHTRSLIDGNQELWENLVNHPFPRQMARGTAPLNGFRHFMIQDATYLEYYARLRMQSITNSRSTAYFTDLESVMAKMSSGLQYANDVRNVCEEQLGIAPHVVASEPMSEQLKQSIELYESVVRDGDWLDMHIVLLPCIMGYYTIAHKLLLDPATIRNTLYYTLWIQENTSAGTFERYKKFINDHINKLPECERRWEYWIDIFGKACETEKAFLELAYEDHKYDVVSDGRYKIRSYGRDGVYLVPGEGGRVFALQEDPNETWTWELTNTRDGYSIKNVATGTFLGVSVTEQFPPYYEANSQGEGYKSWSLNPISLPGKQMYQLFVSSKLQFSLDVDVNQNGSRVFVANGYTGSSQMWLLEAVG